MIIDDPDLDRRLSDDGDPAAMLRLIRRARAAGADDHPAMIDLSRRAAEAGHPGGMLRHAVMLERSADPDRGSAQQWRERAAQAGHREACYQLGSLLGRRSEHRDEALRWLERAAAAGHDKAGLQLPLMLWSAPRARLPDQDDIDAGAAWYRRLLDPSSARVLRHRASGLGRLLDAAVRQVLADRLTQEDPLGRLAGPPYWTLRDAAGRPVVIDLVPYWKPEDWVRRQVEELFAGGWRVVLLHDTAVPLVSDDRRCEVIRIDADRPCPLDTVVAVAELLAGPDRG